MSSNPKIYGSMTYHRVNVADHLKRMDFSMNGAWTISYLNKQKKIEIVFLSHQMYKSIPSE